MTRRPSQGADREADRASRIARLNDAFRCQNNTGFSIDGMLVMTRRLAFRDWAFQSQVIEAVRSFTAFENGNDPYREHDFGMIEVDGEQLFWKIDVYATPEGFDAGDPASDTAFRVLTIMFADEY